MKPGSTLFAVNSSGRILGLRSDKDFKWTELPYLGIDFKRISATNNSLWALGGDHQIYVCVFGIEIPIRVKEETFENQRWNPVDSFSSKLLPTDRPNFSTFDGNYEKTKDQIKLPTTAWQWESPWYVDTRLDGKQLEQDGWTYAVDFPADYHPKKGFTSCVRRRKWIRYRKYIAIDSWSAVPGIGTDPSEEPFIDLAIGGQELPHGDPDESFVWGVTVLGKVYVRQRVTTNSPEGTGWLHIPTPDKCEVSQISVGPTGLVWAVTWHGRALVRHGITRLDPTGQSWSVLDPPGPSSPLSIVAVGNHVVWAISRDKTVWFRNGIHGPGSGDSEALARGTKWVGMVGEMIMLSVGPLDQVIAIQDNSERSVVIRTGITSSDLSGKTWQTISAPLNFGQETYGNPTYITSQHRILPELDDTSSTSNRDDNSKSNVTEGSSNENFKKSFGSRITNTAASSAAATATRMAVGATVGRIPVAGNLELYFSSPLGMMNGPILSQIGTQMVYSEMQKFKPFNEEGEVEDENEDDGVVRLTEKTFESYVSENPGLLIMFYTTWCGPCKKLKPIFISAATKLKTEGINGKLALVNCTKETKLAEKFGIKSYPNLKFFGEFETRDVENLREEQEIIDFVKSSTKTSDISIEDAIKEGEIFAFRHEDQNNAKSMYQSAMESHEDTPPQSNSDDRQDHDHDRQSMTSNDILDREDHYGDVDHLEESPSGPVWVWLTMGSCKLDPSHLPNPWFIEQNSGSNDTNSLSGESWRINILQNLKANNSKADEFHDYEPAVEKSSWVRKGTARVCFAAGNSNSGQQRWENCSLELEQTGTQRGEVEFGTLSIFGMKDRNKEHLSLSEITCVCRSAGDKTLAIHTPARSFLLMPLLLKFAGDHDLEEWQADITAGMNSVMATQLRPYPGSLISVTNKGEVCLFDPTASERSGLDSIEKRTQEDCRFTQSVLVSSRTLPIIHSFENGFCTDSSLFCQLRMHEDGARFGLNLQTGRAVPEADIALHFNPRLDQNKVVFNDRKGGQWGQEEPQPLILMQDDSSAVKVFNPGVTTQILIKCETTHFKISVNGTLFAKFKHRIKPEEITFMHLYGDVEPLKLEYSSKKVIIPPKEMYWRILGGGHMLSVETCTLNQTQLMWALGYDSKVWTYTGGWGGAHFQGSSKSELLGPVEDSRYYYVYENQRWNPITGFTSHGLPTDRYSWSDKSGKLALTKDSIKLPSVHWQWVTDWLIDFTTPGGADHDGWQYATDFPASYHNKKRFTDYVRRRRWTRKCKLATTGPWKSFGSTKLINVAMKPHPSKDLAYVWTITSKGEALFRLNVTSTNPDGSDWSHVTSDVTFQAITIGGKGTDNSPFKVWAIAKDGSVFLRHGITDVAPTGQIWIQAHPPGSGIGSGLKSVTGGDQSLWALDHNGKVWYRQEITPVFPEGTSWTSVANMSSSPNAFTGGDVRAISAHGLDLWAVLDNIYPMPLGSSPAAAAVVSAMGTSAATLGTVASVAINAAGYGNGGPVNGVLARRCGITPGCPTGVGWETIIGGGWKDLSIRGRVLNS